MTLLEYMVEYSRLISSEHRIEADRFLRNNVSNTMAEQIKNSFNKNGNPIDFDGS